MEQVHNYNLFVGLNDKDTKHQKIATVEAFKMIENVCIEKAGGGTIFEGRGVYCHKDGTPVIENSFQVMLFGITEATRDEIIRYLLVALNQESIAFEINDKKSGFISLEDL